MAASGELLHLRRRFFLDRQHHHFIAGRPRRFQREQWKAAVARDHAVAAHLTKPRSERSMNARRSHTSGQSGISARIRSTACVVFSPDLVSSRNALCRLSMASLVNPRRSNPTLFSPKTFDSRGLTVIEYGSTSFVTTL